MAYTKTQGSKT